MAELTETQPSPSPYFASQLIDYLYDEGAALAPVQSWLERTLHKSLNDLSLREKNRQTKDQISIGNAFTSLRQLALLDWKECFERLSRVERALRQDPAGIYPRWISPRATGIAGRLKISTVGPVWQRTRSPSAP